MGGPPAPVGFVGRASWSWAWISGARNPTTRMGLLLAALTMLALASPALAVDGVIEINQAKVMAAGGFPYLLPASGSYRLTSDLMPPVAGPVSACSATPLVNLYS